MTQYYPAAHWHLRARAVSGGGLPPLSRLPRGGRGRHSVKLTVFFLKTCINLHFSVDNPAYWAYHVTKLNTGHWKCAGKGRVAAAEGATLSGSEDSFAGTVRGWCSGEAAEELRCRRCNSGLPAEIS